MTGWHFWPTDPPYLMRPMEGVILWESRYTVIEWRRASEPDEMEPHVANVFEIGSPWAEGRDVSDVWWRPVM